MNNGTPYTDEKWKAWYARKSSSELWQESEERKAEESINTEEELKGGNHE